MSQSNIQQLSRAPVVMQEPQPEGDLSAQLSRDPTFLQVFTLVLWLTCLVVGLLGLWLQSPLPPKLVPTPPPEPPPVQAEVIDVDITREPVMAADDSAPPPDAIPDAPPESPPPLPAVAAPSPGLAFAVPVEGPVRIVSGSQAGGIPARAPAAVERLVYGTGSAGKQPAPDYPPSAVAGHQEGTVGIQFIVGRDGHVIEAHVAQPSPWPLLNQAALTVVRDEWANPRWSVNHPYLVTIRFQLNQL